MRKPPPSTTRATAATAAAINRKAIGACASVDASAAVRALRVRAREVRTSMLTGSQGSRVETDAYNSLICCAPEEAVRREKISRCAIPERDFDAGEEEARVLTPAHDLAE